MFRNEFLSYGVKLEEDVDSVHPRLVCQSRFRYRLRSSGHPPELQSAICVGATGIRAI